MKTRHLNELLDCLEVVTDVGTATLRKEKLKWMYEADRIGKKIFADIQDKWYNELEQTEPLFVAESHAEYVFIWGDGLTAGSKAWFQDIRDKAKGTTGGSFDKKVEATDEPNVNHVN